MVYSSTDITCIVLAGGNSSRMGFDKGFFVVDGVSMVERVINIGRCVTDNIIISSNNNEYKKFGFKVIPDVEKGLGPIGGLASVLNEIETKFAFTIPVDTPFVDPEIFSILFPRVLTENLVAVKYQNNVHPLFMMFNVSYIKEKMPLYIQTKNLKMRDFINNLGSFVDIDTCGKNSIDSKSFLNINSQKDL